MKKLKGIKRLFPSHAWPVEPTKAKSQSLFNEREHSLTRVEKQAEGGSFKDPIVLQLFGLIFLIPVMFQALCLLCGVDSFVS